MEVRPDILIIIIVSAIVTALPRVIPMVLLSRVTLTHWLRMWLGAVPAAILAALLATELLVANQRLVGAEAIPTLIAIVPVLVVVAITRSLMGAVIAGILTVSLLRMAW